MADNTHSICADWGTSNVRVYLLNADGSLADERNSDKGLLSCEGEFSTVLNDLCHDWFASYPDAPVYLSGMIGSREGWLDAGYLDTPNNLKDLPNHLKPIPNQDRPIWIAPGIRHFDEKDNSADIMRGEETQILGALTHLNIKDAIFILPGTHSKWVQVSNDHLMYFNTYMTGEMFNIIKEHSILKFSVGENTPKLDDAFLHGIDLAIKGASLLNQIFTVRTSDVLGLIAKEKQSSHLSGILIGQEITHAINNFGDQPIYIIGSDQLAALYQGALKHLGRKAQLLSGDIASRTGLFSLSSQTKQTL